MRLCTAPSWLALLHGKLYLGEPLVYVVLVPDAVDVALAAQAGDLCGFGLTYYDFDSSGYVKMATEVSPDNSALMRNIRKHKNVLTRSLATISHALLWCARGFGAGLPAEGVVTIQYDDSTVTDTSAEKAQGMAEVAVGFMGAYEYRMRWYSEDEARPGSAQAGGTPARATR